MLLVLCLGSLGADRRLGRRGAGRGLQGGRRRTRDFGILFGRESGGKTWKQMSVQPYFIAIVVVKQVETVEVVK